MQAIDTASLWNIAHLNQLQLLRANFVHHAFSRHAHDYYVIGLVEAGLQKFDTSKDKYVTPPRGIIVLNPGDAHTGEAAIETGFRYRALYPDVETFTKIAQEISPKNSGYPIFPEPLIEDRQLFRTLQNLHHHLEHSDSVLEDESRYHAALAQLVVRHADIRHSIKPTGHEKQEIRKLRRYIEERFAENITLDDLAQHVNWSPFYLLRVFRDTVGLPPHAYLTNFRIQQAQALLAAGHSIVDVTYATGFSNQSHLTRVFKKIIGVTPGQYAKDVNSVQDNT